MFKTFCRVIYSQVLCKAVRENCTFNKERCKGKIKTNPSVSPKAIIPNAEIFL